MAEWAPMTNVDSPAAAAGASQGALGPADAARRAQPGIFCALPAHAVSLEFGLVHAPAEADLAAIAQALLAIEFSGPATMAQGDLVVGLGVGLAHRLGVRPPGLRAMAPIGNGRRAFPATQADLWLFVPGVTAGGAYERAQGLIAALGGRFALVEANNPFHFRDGRDLTGFRDGTENPKGEDAQRAALLCEAPYAGGSFALVQRYVHRAAPFAQLDEAAQSSVFGRDRDTDVELEDAPASAHVKRADQDSFDPPTHLWRRGMPWGTPLRHGSQFVAFMADLDAANRMLRRMAGLDDGIVDALLSYTDAETGSFYFCPPLRDGRLDLGPAR
jgi:porphyrinogen peroxidase